MKRILYLLTIIVLITTFELNAQNKFISKTGHIWIYSKTPLETIEAHNRKVASIVDASNSTIVFELLMRSFKFEKALMEEHFNENYAETEKYPKSSFKGKIINFDKENFSKDGTYKVRIDGDLTIHNITRKVGSDGELTIKDNKIFATSKFSIDPADYGIEIPALVKDKIAKKIEINVDIVYDLKKS